MSRGQDPPLQSSCERMRTGRRDALLRLQRLIPCARPFPSTPMIIVLESRGGHASRLMCPCVVFGPRTLMWNFVFVCICRLSHTHMSAVATLPTASSLHTIQPATNPKVFRSPHTFSQAGMVVRCERRRCWVSSTLPEDCGDAAVYCPTERTRSLRERCSVVGSHRQTSHLPEVLSPPLSFRTSWRCEEGVEWDVDRM